MISGEADNFRKKSREEIRLGLNKGNFDSKSDVKLINSTFQKELYVKFFHIWKGQDIMTFNDTIKNENSTERKFIYTIPRYKIGVVKDVESFESLRKNALIRLVYKSEEEIIEIDEKTNITDKCEKLTKLYGAWNEQWLFSQCTNKNSIEITKQDILLLSIPTKGTLNPLILKIDHDIGAEKQEVCKLRSHGYFLKHFCQGTYLNNLDGHTMTELLQQEFLETILTKITIVDDRLFTLLNNYKFGDNPLKSKYKDGVLSKTLGLHVFGESSETSLNFLKEHITEFGKQHFFIFHLSFVEKIFPAKDESKKYEEFIDTIFELSNSPLAENTIIGMTTGRGRNEWIEKTGRHRANCIHIPIESLQTAIQQGVQFKDDFDIKYNLCKVLFGS